MTCQELVEFLMDFLDGTLSEPLRKCFEEHLAECPDCVAYLTTYQVAVRLGKSCCLDNSGPIPAEVPSDLIKAILCAREQS